MSKRTWGWYYVRVNHDIEIRRFKYRKNAYKYFDLFCKKYPEDHVSMTIEKPDFSLCMKHQHPFYGKNKV